MQKENAQRHTQRLHAFQILYGLSFANIQDRDELKDAYTASPANEATEFVQSFAWELVEGVWTRCEAIDKRITDLSLHWRIGRIGHIELTLLRLAFFELFYRTDTKPEVILNETLSLCKQFAEPAAKKFVIGILETAIKKYANKTPDRGEHCKRP